MKTHIVLEGSQWKVTTKHEFQGKLYGVVSCALAVSSKLQPDVLRLTQRENEKTIAYHIARL